MTDNNEISRGAPPANPVGQSVVFRYGNMNAEYSTESNYLDFLSSADNKDGSLSLRLGYNQVLQDYTAVANQIYSKVAMDAFSTILNVPNDTEDESFISQDVLFSVQISYSITTSKYSLAIDISGRHNNNFVVCPVGSGSTVKHMHAITPDRVQPADSSNLSNNATIPVGVTEYLLIYYRSDKGTLEGKTHSTILSLVNDMHTMLDTNASDQQTLYAPICIMHPGSIMFRLGKEIVPNNIKYKIYTQDRLSNALPVSRPYSAYSDSDLANYKASSTYFMRGCAYRSGIPVDDLLSFNFSLFPMMYGQDSVKPIFPVDLLRSYSTGHMRLDNLVIGSRSGDTYYDYISSTSGETVINASVLNNCDITFKALDGSSSTLILGCRSQWLGCKLHNCNISIDLSEITANKTVTIYNDSGIEFSNCDITIKYNPLLSADTKQNIYFQYCKFNDCRFFSKTSNSYTSATLTAWVNVFIRNTSCLSNCAMFGVWSNQFDVGSEHIIFTVSGDTYISGCYQPISATGSDNGSRFYLVRDNSAYPAVDVGISNCDLSGALIYGFSSIRNCTFYGIEIPFPLYNSSLFRSLNIDMYKSIIKHHIELVDTGASSFGLYATDCYFGSDSTYFKINIDLSSYTGTDSTRVTIQSGGCTICELSAALCKIVADTVRISKYDTNELTSEITKYVTPTA